MKTKPCLHWFLCETFFYTDLEKTVQPAKITFDGLSTSAMKYRKGAKTTTNTTTISNVA